MKENKAHTILASIAEEGAPAREIDLWEDLRSHLESSELRHSKGVHSMKPNFARTPVFRLSLAALAVLAILAVFFVTPPGRTLAQSLFHFFNPVETLSPLLTPGETPVGRTYPPFYDQCGDYGNPTCSLQQIQTMVDFQVKGLSNLPEAMAFTGVTGGPQWVSLLYQGNGAALALDERPVDAGNQASEIGTGATVETVLIHPRSNPNASITAEYVQGAWAGSWFSNADVQTLVWQEDQVIYTLQGYGSITFLGRPLDRDGLVELAGSMTAETAVLQVTSAWSMQSPTLAPEPAEDGDFQGPLFAVADLETLAGVQVDTPASLPGGLIFHNGSYLRSRNNVCLYYHTSMNDMMNLTIIENPDGNLPELTEWARLSNEEAVSAGFSPLPPLKSVSQVSINGAEGGQATFVDGWLSLSVLCGSREGTFANENTFFWKRLDGRSFILSIDNELGSVWLTRMEMIRVAEDLNGVVSSIPAGTQDPERMASLEIARSQWGSSFLVPAETFGRTFTYAQMISEGESQTLNLVYTGPLMVSVQVHPSDTLDAIFNEHPDIYRKTTVRGQPALYIQGCPWVDRPYEWDCAYGDHVLTWFENGLKYVLLSRPTIGALSQELLTSMAESLK